MNIICEIPPESSTIDCVSKYVAWVDTIYHEGCDIMDPKAVIIDDVGNVGLIRSSALKVISDRDLPTPYTVAKMLEVTHPTVPDSAA